MKTLIVYDSMYGNTQKIAEAIGRKIDDEVKVVSIKEVSNLDLNNYNLLIVGSPTHAGRPTEPVKSFLKNIPDNYLANKYIAAFDTGASKLGQGLFVKTIINIFGYAAKHIQHGLQKKGGEAIVNFQGYSVKGKEGPLEAGELEKAVKWGKEINNQAINKIKS